MKLALMVLAAFLSVVGGAGAAGPERVAVFFTRGEQLASVSRALGQERPVENAVRHLFEGPTAAERARGLRTNIPAAARLSGVTLEAGVARIEVSRPFTSGRRASLHARLAQLVYTATALAGVERVQVSVDGVVLRRLGALVIAGGVGRDLFEPQPQGGTPSQPPPAPFSRLVQRVQLRLIELRYLPARSADGLLGAQTRHAILAFEGWERLRRDGRATRALLSRLRAAVRPGPRTRAGRGRRIEVSIARQVALLVSGSEVVRAIHVSTGARGFDTPRGTFRVFRKELRSWSYPYRVWLPFASYFTGGVAFHESADVPTYPASHGCVRVPASEARFVYDFATLRTPVLVTS